MIPAQYTTARAALGLSFLTLLSPLAGLAVEVALAWRFGASATVDAYRSAAQLLFFAQHLFLIQTLPHAIVPVMMEYRERSSQRESLNVALSVAKLLLLPTLFFSFLVFLWPQPVARLIAPGLTGDASKAAIVFVRWFAATFGLLLWAGTATGILYANRTFWIPPAAQLAGNIVLASAIAGLTLFPGSLTIICGVLFAALTSFGFYFLRIWPLVRSAGLPPLGNLGICHPGVRRVLQLTAPLLGSICVAQFIGIMINRSLSLLPSGSLASFGYTWKLGQVVTLGACSLATVLFPKFADSVLSENEAGFRDLCTRALRMALFLALPAVCLCFALRMPLVQFALQRGAFEVGDSARVSQLFALLLLGSPAAAAIPYLEKMLYARKQTHTVFGAQFASAVLITIFCSQAAEAWGTSGLMLLAGAILPWITTSILLVSLQRKHRPFEGWSLLRFLSTVVPVALISAAATHLVREALGTLVRPSAAMAWAIPGLALTFGVGLFFWLSSAFKLPEAEMLTRYVRWQTSAVAGWLHAQVWAR